MGIHRPFYISLDSSAWIDIGRHKNDPYTKEIKRIFDSGVLIPYFTRDHFLEICRGQNPDPVLEEISSLPHVAYPLSTLRPGENRLCGAVFDIQLEELRVLLEEPHTSWDFIIEKVKPKVLGGFCSGQKLCNDPVIRAMAKDERKLAQLVEKAISVAPSKEPFEAFKWLRKLVYLALRSGDSDSIVKPPEQLGVPTERVGRNPSRFWKRLRAEEWVFDWMKPALEKALGLPEGSLRAWDLKKSSIVLCRRAISTSYLGC